MNYQPAAAALPQADQARNATDSLIALCERFIQQDDRWMALDRENGDKPASAEVSALIGECMALRDVIAQRKATNMAEVVAKLQVLFKEDPSDALVQSILADALHVGTELR